VVVCLLQKARRWQVFSSGPSGPDHQEPAAGRGGRRRAGRPSLPGAQSAAAPGRGATAGGAPARGAPAGGAPARGAPVWCSTSREAPARCHHGLQVRARAAEGPRGRAPLWVSKLKNVFHCTDTMCYAVAYGCTRAIFSSTKKYCSRAAWHIGIIYRQHHHQQDNTK
jgi:hypothetical protein